MLRADGVQANRRSLGFHGWIGRQSRSTVRCFDTLPTIAMMDITL
jgi:hypothetical protein